MISLRRRLLLSILSALAMVWFATAVWFHLEVRQETRAFLDARLVESARMVHGLLSRGELLQATGGPAAGAPTPLAGDARAGALACQILADGGRLLAVSSGAPETALTSIDRGFGSHRLGDTEWRVYVLPVAERGLRIVVGERRDLRQALVGEIALAMLAPFVILVPLIAALVWFGIARGLRPLHELGEWIQRRDPNSLDAVPAAAVPTEVRPLVASIDELFARLRAAFERERRFTADAAHELRTPLAALKAHVQVARAAAEPQTRERALARLERAVDRSGKLVETMLALARLEAGEDEADTAHPGDVLREVVEELTGLGMPAHGLAVEIGAALPRVGVPPSAFRMGARNLVENALRHTPSGGRIGIALQPDQEHLALEVRDTGPGIPEAELADIRKPFRRGTGSGAGSGLGLAIVERIGELYGCRLRLENRAGGGLCARWELPVRAQARSSGTPPRDARG